jgi:hypothetical protein
LTTVVWLEAIALSIPTKRCETSTKLAGVHLGGANGFSYRPGRPVADSAVLVLAPAAVAGARSRHRRRRLCRGADTARWAFIGIDHGTTGTAVLLEDATGAQFVRLQHLDTSNDPDLFVYLSTNPPEGAEGEFDDDYVNLGRLEGNVDSSNYLIPAGTDLARYASVVIGSTLRSARLCCVDHRRQRERARGAASASSTSQLLASPSLPDRHIYGTITSTLTACE